VTWGVGLTFHGWDLEKGFLGEEGEQVQVVVGFHRLEIAAPISLCELHQLRGGASFERTSSKHRHHSAWPHLQELLGVALGVPGDYGELIPSDGRTGWVARAVAHAVLGQRVVDPQRNLRRDLWNLSRFCGQGGVPLQERPC
jgi:hypothetical protein